MLIFLSTSRHGHPFSLFLSLLLVFALRTSPLQASSSTQQTCTTNLRTIEVALEMYELDSGPLRATDSATIIKILGEKRFLKGSMTCPGPRFSFGNTRGGPGFMEKVIPAAFAVYDSTSSQPEYRFDENRKPFCTFHGPIEGMDERARIAREKRFSPRLLNLFDNLNFRLSWKGFQVLGVVALLLFGVFVAAMRRR